MKLFITILIVFFLIAAGYIAFTKIKAIDPGISQTSDISVTITGTVSKVDGNPRYSYQIKESAKITPLASQKVDLSSFVGKKVTVTGEYSGTTLYVDTISASK